MGAAEHMQALSQEEVRGSVQGAAVQDLHRRMGQETAHHRGHSACPEPNNALILDHCPDHLPNRPIGVVLRLQAGLDQVKRVSDGCRKAATDAAGKQVAQQGDVVLIPAQCPLDGAVRAQTGTCKASRASQHGHIAICKGAYHAYNMAASSEVRVAVSAHEKSVMGG